MQIDLAFSDTTLSNNSIYKVVYDDGTPNIIEINSIIGQNIPQPVIDFTQQPASVTIWDTTTNPITTLAVSAVIEQSPIHQKSIKFQWYMSNNASSGFAPIENATNPTYEYDSSTINGPNKKYFKCIISYEYVESISSHIVYIEKLNSPVIKITYQSPSMTLPNLSTSTPLSVGASTPLVSSNPAFVKMTLTTSEARAELIKWFTIQSNYESILATFFNRSTSSNGRHGFYTSLHDYVFTTAPGTVELVSAVAEQFIPLGLTKATTLYKIRFKTTSGALYRTRASGTNGATTELPVGSFVEFYTLFSFIDNNNQIQRTTGAHYNMNLTTTFSTAGQNTTSISWVSNAANAPSGTNPIKNGSYPIKYTSADNVTIFIDSLYLPSRPSLSSANITTYNIRS